MGVATGSQMYGTFEFAVVPINASFDSCCHNLNIGSCDLMFNIVMGDVHYVYVIPRYSIQRIKFPLNDVPSLCLSQWSQYYVHELNR